MARCIRCTKALLVILPPMQPNTDFPLSPSERLGFRSLWILLQQQKNISVSPIVPMKRLFAVRQRFLCIYFDFSCSMEAVGVTVPT